MLPNELTEAQRPLKRLYIVLWFALTAAIVLYLLVAFLTVGNIAGSSASIDPIIRYVLTLISLSVGGISLLYWRHSRSNTGLQRLLARDIGLQDLQKKANKLVVQSRTNGSPDQKTLSQLSTLTAFDRRRYAVAVDLFLPFLINLALNETVALLGLVLSLLSRDLWQILPFAAGAILMNIYMLPKLENLMERCEQWRT
jgi:hypothetical protein